MKIVARAFIGILQNILRGRTIFFLKSKGCIFNELQVSFINKQMRLPLF